MILFSGRFFLKKGIDIENKLMVTKEDGGLGEMI